MLMHSPFRNLRFCVAGEGVASPVTMDETAAQVHTMTLWPSLKPSVCSMKPSEEKTMLMHRPAGAASQDRRPASRNPVRQQAADSPKQAPACIQEIMFENGRFAFMQLGHTRRQNLERTVK